VATILDYEEEEVWERAENTSKGVGIRKKSGRGRGSGRKNTSLFTRTIISQLQLLSYESN